MATKPVVLAPPPVVAISGGDAGDGLMFILSMVFVPALFLVGLRWRRGG